MNTIPVKLIEYNAKTGKALKETPLKLHHCFNMRYPILEIHLPNKSKIKERAIYISVSRILNLLFNKV